MRSYLALAAAAMLGCCGLVHADTINVYTLNATLSNGSASGTVTLDATTGKFTASSITVTTSLGSSVFTGAPSTVDPESTYTRNVFSSANPLTTFSLDLPTSSLVGYVGGSLCTLTATCASVNSTNVAVLGAGLDAATSGMLTLLSTTAPTAPVAVTPEPSSLLLLGTGVLGVGGLLRRRLA